MTLIIILSAVALVIIAFTLFFMLAPQIGSNPTAEQRRAFEKSPQYRDGKFHNSEPAEMKMPPLSVMYNFMTQGTSLDPKKQIATIKFDKAAFESDTTGRPVFAWFGHSTLLMRIAGKNLLIDPVFGSRASMFSFMGPEGYNYSEKYSIDQLPTIDAVILSHDHYDHLDYPTILQLKEGKHHFYMPLGVGCHLVKWGIAPERIHEFDWHEGTEYENIRLTLVPSRHFSGRGLTNRFSTLWGGWVIKTDSANILFGGDSGYFPGFKKIGDQYGPFDWAFVECGQYSEYWQEIHMLPEESALAAEEVNAARVVPIHWGKFTLSIHTWDEPIARFMKAAENKNYKVTVPCPGEVFGESNLPAGQWWK